MWRHVGTGKKAPKNLKVDSDEEEDTTVAEIHEELEDLRKVEKGITEVETNLTVVPWY
jgi:hypothetical protein